MSKPYKSLAELIGQDEDIAELAALARLQPAEGERFEVRRPELGAEAIEKIVDGWVERGVARKCARAVLTDAVDDLPPIRAMKRWRKSGKPWFRLQGGRGIGKSWTGGVWLMQGKQSEGLQIEGAETVGWAEWDKRWEELARIPRLVIDDPDIEDGRPKMWFAVLAPRYRRGLETAITTNAFYDRESGRNAFWEWWGKAYRESMESRFAEIGHAEQLGGEDLRRRRQ